MIDIKLVREDYETVKKNYERRGKPEFIKTLQNVKKLDEEWRNFKTELQKLQQQRNDLTIKISKSSSSEKNKFIKETKNISDKIKNGEAKQKELEEKLWQEKLKLPNLLHESVPEGKDDTENVEIKKFGKIPKFDFEPKNHLEIAIQNNWMDGDRATKVAGAGFWYIKGDLALLDHALQRYAIDFLTKKGFTPVHPPMMIHKRPYEGVTSLSDFEDVMYKVQDDDLYMIATSEHSIASMHMDEVIPENRLPLKYVGISSCFRREIGTHGKYTKGLYRMHQFNKVEQLPICKPEQSWKIFEEIQKNSEDMYNELGIAFRVVNICTGDMGIVATKKYDIEGWMSDGKYRELGSCSNCLDFQARRLNMRYEKRNGEREYVHTLNNTGIATSRAMIVILEQNQQKDYSVKIPKVLQPYMNGKKVIGGSK